MAQPSHCVKVRTISVCGLHGSKTLTQRNSMHARSVMSLESSLSHMANMPVHPVLCFLSLSIQIHPNFQGHHKDIDTERQHEYTASGLWQGRRPSALPWQQFEASLRQSCYTHYLFSSLLKYAEKYSSKHFCFASTSERNPAFVPAQSHVCLDRTAASQLPHRFEHD